MEGWTDGYLYYATKNQKMKFLASHLKKKKKNNLPFWYYKK